MSLFNNERITLIGRAELEAEVEDFFDKTGIGYKVQKTKSSLLGFGVSVYTTNLDKDDEEKYLGTYHSEGELSRKIRQSLHNVEIRPLTYEDRYDQFHEKGIHIIKPRYKGLRGVIDSLFSTPSVKIENDRNM